jgi:hypothetical protein
MYHFGGFIRFTHLRRRQHNVQYYLKLIQMKEILLSCDMPRIKLFLFYLLFNVTLTSNERSCNESSTKETSEKDCVKKRMIL